VSVVFELHVRARGAVRRAAASGALFDLRSFHILLGVAFLTIEVTEFAGMVAKGAGPSRSAFLSAFFTLVGTHGVHVASGLIALIYLVAQVIAKGLQAAVLRRLLCWSLFWHALDIVWVGVFTLVYLMGD
jgi:heme/copper-type cytochrome/quinol oxidase subunit 3